MDSTTPHGPVIARIWHGPTGLSADGPTGRAVKEYETQVRFSVDGAWHYADGFAMLSAGSSAARIDLRTARDAATSYAAATWPGRAVKVETVKVSMSDVILPTDGDTLAPRCTTITADDTTADDTTADDTTADDTTARTITRDGRTFRVVTVPPEDPADVMARDLHDLRDRATGNPVPVADIGGAATGDTAGWRHVSANLRTRSRIPAPGPADRTAHVSETADHLRTRARLYRMAAAWADGRAGILADAAVAMDDRAGAGVVAAYRAHDRITAHDRAAHAAATADGRAWQVTPADGPVAAYAAALTRAFYRRAVAAALSPRDLPRGTDRRTIGNHATTCEIGVTTWSEVAAALGVSDEYAVLENRSERAASERARPDVKRARNARTNSLNRYARRAAGMTVREWNAAPADVRAWWRAQIEGEATAA